MSKSAHIIVCLLCYFSFACPAQPSDLRQKVYKTYAAEVGTREKTGHNDGEKVEAYLNYVWLKKGNPWCAAFVSWSFGKNGIRMARSGGCVQLMEQGKIIYLKDKTTQIPQRSDVFFIYFANKGRVAHTGFIDVWDDKLVSTIEGNTNEAGSREGDGVYRKRRLRKQIYSVVKFID